MKTETVSLAELIAKIDDGADAVSVGVRVTSEILENRTELAQQLFSPLVIAEVTRTHRLATRAAENSAFNAEARPGKPYNPAAAMKVLAQEMFYIVSAGMVAWNLATAPQHDEREAYQRGRGLACIEDAERHAQAAKEIRAAGVTCLAELQ
jgi:hypothetical protein